MKRPVYTADFGNSQTSNTPASFVETLQAQLGYQYAPIADFAHELMDFADAPRDPDFDFAQAVKGHEEYAQHLVGARNQEHFDFKVNSIKRNLERRSVLGQSGIFNSLVAGLLDPLNLAFPVPIMKGIGGMVTGTMGVKQAFKAGAKGGAVVGGVSEAIRVPFDDLATPTEVAVNMAANTGLGGLVGSVPSVARNLIPSGNAAQRNFELGTSRGTTLGDEVDGVKLNYEGKVNERGDGVELSKDGININYEQVVENFYKKPWTKAEVKGAKPLAQMDIPSPIEYMEFLVHREVARQSGRPQDPKTLVKWVDKTNERALKQMTSGYGQKKTLLSDHPLFNMIPTPLKRTRASDLPDYYKKKHADLVENNAVTLDRNAEGLGVQSIETNTRKYETDLNNLIAELQDLQVQNASDLTEAPSVFGQRDEFLTKKMSGTNSFSEEFSDLIHLRAKMADPSFSRSLTDYEKKAIGKINKVYDDILEKAKAVGLMDGVENIPSLIKKTNDEINLINKAYLQDAIEEGSNLDSLLQEKLGRLEKKKRLLDGLPELKKKQNYLSRLYRSKEIAANPQMQEELIQLIIRYSPDESSSYWDDAVGDYVQLGARERAERIVDTIISTDSYDPSVSGKLSTQFVNFRSLGNIPDYELLKFIHTDPSILHDYVRKMALSIEYRKFFGDQSFDEFLQQAEIDLTKAGYSNKAIRDYKRDMVADFDSLRGAIITDPARWTGRFANVLKNLTQATYLGRAAQATMGDFHGIIGQHGLRPWFDLITSPIDRATAQLSRKENAEYVEALGYTQTGMNNRITSDNTRLGELYREEKLINSIMQRYHSLPFVGSFLTPMTKMWRSMDGMLRSSRIIKHSIEWRDGKIDPKDIAFLARMGIDEDTAKNIANIKNDAGETPYSKPNSLFFANVSEWSGRTAKDRAAKQSFINALETGIHNTVVIASNADKPIIVRGAAYVKYRKWMKPLGLEPDPRVSVGDEKVVKVSDGVLALPFVFMSFGLGALPRVTARLADPTQRHRMVQVMSAVALGYGVLKMRKSDWWFENNSYQDILARSIDYAGLAGIYGDIAYTGLEMLAGAGVIDEKKSFIKPKYYGIDGYDALSAPFGAPVGLLHGYGKSISNFVNGEVDEGVRELARNTPNFLTIPWQYDLADLSEDIGIINER
tara:strand:- start:3029 stop:6517 length:3489 start_codon:yes stop_codon:yes gene_type:complete